MWLGKQSEKHGDSNTEQTDALVPASERAGQSEQAEQAEQPGPSGSAGESKQQKELRELQAYLKQLNAKTNLLDLASEVFADKKLLTYGWMTLELA